MSAIRDLELDDLDVIEVEGDGPRVVMAFYVTEHDAGADGITLLGLADSKEALFAVVKDLVRVRDYPVAPYGEGLRSCFYRLSKHDPRTQIPLEEIGFQDGFAVVSAPIGVPLDLSLERISELRETLRDKPSFRPS